MTDVIPAAYRDLFSKQVFAHLATVMPDGSPQVTPVWCEFDGQYVLINTAIGRRKDLNMQRDGRVSMSLIDPDNPYRYLEVRGRVAERTENGANDDINRLSMKYLGTPYPRLNNGESRVTYRIAPERITSMG